MAGGVFLGAGLIHMLPDAQEAFSTAFGAPDYPWFALLAGGGFLLILCLDKLLAAPLAPTGSDERAGQLLSAYVLLLVLAVHSLITGIALGVETGAAATLVILLAVLAHKGTAAFALGVALVQGGIPAARLRLLIALFALTTPIGIAVGTAIST